MFFPYYTEENISHSAKGHNIRKSDTNVRATAAVKASFVHLTYDLIKY